METLIANFRKNFAELGLLVEESVPFPFVSLSSSDFLPPRSLSLSVPPSLPFSLPLSQNRRTT
eukprot:1356824-Amorphochlora_amoeboformis.AAC.1